MAARIARAKATVLARSNGDVDELKGVSIVVRLNVATVRLGGDVILSRENVARVVPQGRRSWELHFEDSPDVWTVTDEKRRCCGRA